MLDDSRAAFKIGAIVTVSVRRIVVSMATGYPWKEVFERCLVNLKRHYPQPS